MNIGVTAGIGRMLLVVAAAIAVVATACASNNDQQEQRDGSNTNPAATGRFIAVDAGYGHTCGLRDTGAIECWGWNSNGQTDTPPGSFIAVAAGRFHTCGLREDGEIECWGAASNPQGRFIAVSAGYEHSCAIRTGGEIECWGENTDGQANVPAGSYRDVSAGGRHTCAIRSDGEIECWGASGYRIADTPELRFGDDPFVTVSAGETHACARSEAGFVVCWGDASIPPGAGPEGSTYPFVAVGAGNANTCAVHAIQRFAPDGGPPTEGELVCWGWNAYGQANPPAGSFTAVSAGGAHVCALTPAGAIECWGTNENGQLDAPSPTATAQPNYTPQPASGSETMTTAEYTEWCVDQTKAFSAAIRATGDTTTVGDGIEIHEMLARAYERIADRVPQEARAGHDLTKEWATAVVDALDDYDLSLPEDELLDDDEWRAKLDTLAQEYDEDVLLRHIYDWCDARRARTVPETTDTGVVEGKPQFSAPPEMMLEQGVDYRAIIELENGSIAIDLFEDDAPIHVNNFVFLAEREFYDGLTFHRVVPGFVAQGGDPTTTGTGGAGYTLPDETPTPALTLDARGVISMARSGAGASSSQFFITLTPAGFLDEQSFTAFGRVTAGMEVLDAFEERDPTAQQPAGPRIVSITIER